MFFAKIPRHTRQNAITEGDLECILTRNCEGTEHFLRREQAKIIPAGEYGDCPTDTITKKFETICKSPACMRI